MWSATCSTVTGGGGPCGSRVQAQRSADRNDGTNVTMHTPPLPRSRVSTSSGTLRGCPQSARADEWLKITGRVVTARASCMVVSATCDRSTSMPIRFISVITVRPKSLSPPSRGVSVALSAHETFWL
ncbi:hypothetical protein Q0Z83_102720 [Actinoplanes sichuanensis]|nr:hypothetical protein Q0Z83_102720 [Actinoplanes sichuanensis]